MNKPFILFKSFRAQITAIFILLICFSAAVGNLLIYEYSLKANMDQAREKLIIIAQTVAMTLDPATLSKIPLDRAGMESEAYKAIEAKLLKIKDVAPSLAYIYILKRTEKNNILQFMIDIHPGSYKSNKAPAVPGEKYDAVNMPDLRRAFLVPAADKKITADKWGAFLSGYAPIYNAMGMPMAVLGIDMDADDVYQIEAETKRRMLLVFLASIIISALIGILIAGEVVSPIKRFIEGTRRISSGDLRYKVDARGSDEIIELGASFNRMSANLLKAREALLSYFYRAVQSLIRVLEARDPYTKGHSDRVADYAGKIAIEMGLPKDKMRLLHDASLLHDIGKLGIHDIVLSKKVGLTPEDWHTIRKHPEIGAEILKPISLDKELLAVVKEHHERYDGTGYPDGLIGSRIDPLAAIVAVADSYDAMISQRGYKKELTKAEAIEQLKVNSGSQFDPKMVEAFVRVLERE